MDDPGRAGGAGRVPVKAALATPAIAMFALLLALPKAAEACSCARETLAQQSARAALVVDAVALVHWTDPHRARTLLRVVEVEKGGWRHPLLLVRHAVEGAACGLVFAPGRRYTLTFHRASAAGSPARIGLCRVWQGPPG